MKRVSGLFEPLISDENLLQAIDEVNRTHHWRTHHRPNACTAWVELTREERVKDLREVIVNGFEPQEPRVTRRWDASARKWRTICEPAQWPDQYVHHALIQVLQPVLMRGMDFYCCGSIRGRGPRHEQKAIERWMRTDRKGTKYELSGDIHHFYDSLTPSVVMDRMRQLVKDRRVLDLIERIVRDGVQIGSYTSQWFANAVLQPMDQMVRDSGLCSHYGRYMDNLTIFGPNKRQLRKLKHLIAQWLHAHHLELKGDWQIFPAADRLPDAVGFRFGRDYTIPRKHNLLRLKRAVARVRKRAAQGKRIFTGAASSVLSRLGQLKHCNNRNIYRLLFRGERLTHGLKGVVRQGRQKEELTWSTYLARKVSWKFCAPKAVPTPT